MVRAYKVSFPLDLCFHDAVQRDDVDEVRAFLEQAGSKASALVNSFCVCGLTALHHSSLEGGQTLTEVLLSFGANPHTFDLNGWQPLHSAASRGHEHVVRQLLKAGADPFAPTASTGELPYDLTDDNSWTLRILLSGSGADSLYSRPTSSADSSLCSDCFTDSSDSGLDTSNSDNFPQTSNDVEKERNCQCLAKLVKTQVWSVHETKRSTLSRCVGVVGLISVAVMRRATVVHIEPPRWLETQQDDDARLCLAPDVQLFQRLSSTMYRRTRTTCDLALRASQTTSTYRHDLREEIFV